ncbi:MAG: hypothetical protein ABW119_22100 [Candidatus Thiodiazotropha lotti]
MAGTEKEEQTAIGSVSQFQKFVYGTVQALVVLGVGASVHTGVGSFGNTRAIESITISMESLSRAIDVLDSRQNDSTKMMYQIARINGEQTVEMAHLHDSIKECHADLDRMKERR